LFTSSSALSPALCVSLNHTVSPDDHTVSRGLRVFTAPGATFSKLLRKILGKDSYLIDDLGKTAILQTS